jgi:hypothetical protein
MSPQALSNGIFKATAQCLGTHNSIPKGGKDVFLLHTSSRAHPASYPMGAGGKAARM